MVDYKLLRKLAERAGASSLDLLAYLGAVDPGTVMKLLDDIDKLREALVFYADKDHFQISDWLAWDTVSGEPQNFWCDDAGTATVEDGWVASEALRNVIGESK